MRLKIMMAVLWAAGLCANGCMTEQSSSEPEEAVVDQAVSTGVRCSDKTWRVNFYSDATLTTQVGSMWCVCFQIEQLTGTTSNFTKLVNEFTCDLR